MTDFERLFSEGTPDRDKLTQNGFRETRNGYFRESPLCGFLLRIGVSVGGKVRAELYDADADAPYTLHFVESAGGSFVAEVRSAYERALKELAEKCFDHAVFTSRYAKRLVEYARKDTAKTVSSCGKERPTTAYCAVRTITSGTPRSSPSRGIK